MNWIKITEATRIPEGTRVLLREEIAKDLIYYKGATSKRGGVIIDDSGSMEVLRWFTHYAVINEPNDIEI